MKNPIKRRIFDCFVIIRKTLVALGSISQQIECIQIFKIILGQAHVTHNIFAHNIKKKDKNTF